MSDNYSKINTSKSVRIILQNPFECFVRVTRLTDEEIKNATTTKLHNNLGENANCKILKVMECNKLL